MSINRELNKLAQNIHKAKKAAIYRGADITQENGFKDLPLSVFNIPADSSIAYITDDKVAQYKTIEQYAQKYALISKLGGMSYKSQNLIDYSTGDLWKEITLENGEYTVNLDIDTSDECFLSIMYLKAGTYTLMLNNKSALEEDTGGYCSVALCVGSDIENWVADCNFYSANNSCTFTVIQDGEYSLILDIIDNYGEDQPVVTLTDFKFKPMLVAGDKVVPFEPHFTGLRHSKVTQVVSNGTEVVSYKPYTGVIDALEIPEEVQALDGYGKSINNEFYNYIEFINGRVLYHKIIETIILDGSEQWRQNCSIQNEYEMYVTILTSLTDKKYVSRSATTSYVLCDRYSTTRLSSAVTDVGIDAYDSNGFKGFVVAVRPENVATTTLSKFVQSVKENPLTVHLALLEPEIIDITKYFTRDNFITIEEGGTMTFENEYNNPVPSTIKYVLKTGV